MSLWFKITNWLHWKETTWICVKSISLILSNSVWIHFVFMYYVLFDWYPCLVISHLRAIQTCFSNLFFSLFIFLLLCYFTIWTQQLKNQIFSSKASWRYLYVWTLILSNIRLPYTWYSFFMTGYWYRNIIKAKKRLKKQIFIALRCITTKHGYQSKRTYGKVVRKQKMDSYIVG
jgi:magnesium-transporting ATPase (P-type)